MNKSDLAKQLAEKASLSKGDAEKCVAIVWESIQDALTQGERVEIRGFGSFSVKHFDAREGRNPKTGESIKIEPRSLPRFKAGKDLKDRINHK
ncbi:integration host factor subunit beta [bacterium]|nr:integration host factor subunit beta [bacterium]